MSNNHGYTLVEVLVVLAIITIIAGISIPGLMWLTSNDVGTEVSGLYSTLHRAKTGAISDHRDTAVIYLLRGNDVRGYTIAHRMNDVEFKAYRERYKNEGHPLDTNRTYHTLVQEQEIGASLHNPFILTGRMYELPNGYRIQLDDALPIRVHDIEGVLVRPLISFASHDPDSDDIRTDYRNMRWPATVFAAAGPIITVSEKQRQVMTLIDTESEQFRRVELHIATGRVKVAQ